MHFDEERGTLVYYIGQTTDEQMQYFKDAMTKAGINIKIARNMLTVTPKSIDGPVELSPDIESLNAVLESLTLDDISINNTKYKEKKEKEDELIATAAKGQFVSPELGPEMTTSQLKRLRAPLQRKSLDSYSRHVDYGRIGKDGVEYFTFDLDDDQEWGLAKLVEQYILLYMGLTQKDSQKVKEVRDSLSADEDFTPDVVDSIKDTRTFKTFDLPSGSDWIYLIKISTQALFAVAESVDAEHNTNTLKTLVGSKAAFVRVIGAIVKGITPEQDEDNEFASSWIFSTTNWDEARVFQTKSDRYYLHRHGIDSTWRASRPWGKDKNYVRNVGINT